MIFFPISFGFILIIAIFLGCPIIALGKKIVEIFDFFVTHIVEFSIAAFIICFIVALIWLLIKRDLTQSLFIFLNCPMVAVFTFFMVAEFLKMASGGIVEAIVAFILYSIFTFIGLAAMVVLAFFSYCLTVDSDIPKESSSILVNLLIFLICLILQILIFVFFIRLL